MSNLVDLSFIHRFSSLNNIKQIGGGKIFYYTDKSGNRIGIVDPKISRHLNRILESPHFSSDFINIDGKSVYLVRNSDGIHGIIHGDIDQPFIGEDDPDEQISATEDEELEQKTDTQLRASSFLAPSRLAAAAAASSSYDADSSMHQEIPVQEQDPVLLSFAESYPKFVPLPSLSPATAESLMLSYDSDSSMQDPEFTHLPRNLRAAASNIDLVSDPLMLSSSPASAFQREVIWSKRLENMSVTLIVIPSFATINPAKRFVDELGLLFNESNLVASDKLLKVKKPTSDTTSNQLSFRERSKRVDDNLFDLYRVENFIAVVCKKEDEYILYFVDPSNGEYREILKVEYEIIDVVFNPVHSDTKFQFAITGDNDDEGYYPLDLVDYDFSDSSISTEDLGAELNLDNCTIAFSHDGKSIIISCYCDDADETCVLIIRLDNIHGFAYRAVIAEDRCIKIKLSPLGNLLVIECLYGIYVYYLTLPDVFIKDELLQLHSKYIVDKDDPNFDDSNGTISYTDRKCELSVVDNFYETLVSTRLCIAVCTSHHKIHSIHLCDVNEKKKYKEFVFPDLSIYHMELYLDRIHLILNTNQGIYALNTITSQINKIMDMQSQSFGMIEQSIFCSNLTRNILKRTDLHQLEDLLQQNDPSAQALLSSSVREGFVIEEDVLTSSDSETHLERKSRPAAAAAASAELPSETQPEPESESESESSSGSRSPSPAGTRPSQGSSKRQKYESDGGRYNPIYIHHCY